MFNFQITQYKILFSNFQLDFDFSFDVQNFDNDGPTVGFQVGENGESNDFGGFDVISSFINIYSTFCFKDKLSIYSNDVYIDFQMDFGGSDDLGFL